LALIFNKKYQLWKKIVVFNENYELTVFLFWGLYFIFLLYNIYLDDSKIDYFVSDLMVLTLISAAAKWNFNFLEKF